LSLGKLNVDLNRGRDELPDAVKQDVHKIVESCSGQTQVVERLYQYLQKIPDTSVFNWGSVVGNPLMQNMWLIINTETVKPCLISWSVF